MPKLEIKLHTSDNQFIKNFTKAKKDSSSVKNSTNIYIIH